MKKYIALVGSENNVGDHLIVESGLNIIKQEISCEIIKFNRFDHKDSTFYDLVNNSNGLILLGGPALRPSFLKKIYNLDVDKVKTKIITLGIGWKDLSGSFFDTFNYYIGKKESLKKLEFSVRDYYSKFCIENNIEKTSYTTGCPALYSNMVGVKPVKPKSIQKIVFSVGVEYSKSKSLMNQTYNLIELLNNNYDLTVAFHHGLSKNYKKARNFNQKLYSTNKKLESYLISKKINYCDISGQTDNFKKLYKDTDLHIGYRVHAHIYSMSLNKPTILINEDGRGKALSQTISGLYFDAFSHFKKSLTSKILNKLFNYDRYITNKNLPVLILNNMKYEFQSNNYNRIFRYRNDIDNHFKIMVSYIKNNL